MLTKLPIIVYHRVHRPDDVTMPNDARRVDVPEFTRQMDYLSEAGFQTVTYPQIAAWLLEGTELPERPVAIDFDDNRLAVLENAFPILSERGLKATVFVITDLADGKDVFGQAGQKDFPSMNWDLYGWALYSHRSAVIRALHEPLSPPDIQRRARLSMSNVRMSTGNVREILKLFVQVGIVQRIRIKKKVHPAYRLTDLGQRLRSLLIAVEAGRC